MANRHGEQYPYSALEHDASGNALEVDSSANAPQVCHSLDDSIVVEKKPIGCITGYFATQLRQWSSKESL